jgi:hypothetical protein
MIKEIATKAGEKSGGLRKAIGMFAHIPAP